MRMTESEIRTMIYDIACVNFDLADEFNMTEDDVINSITKLERNTGFENDLYYILWYDFQFDSQKHEYFYNDNPPLTDAELWDSLKLKDYSNKHLLSVALVSLLINWKSAFNIVVNLIKENCNSHNLSKITREDICTCIGYLAQQTTSKLETLWKKIETQYCIDCDLPF